MTTPKLTGIVETGLIVADVDRAVEFYVRVFGLKVMFRDFRMAATAIWASWLHRGCGRIINRTRTRPAGIFPACLQPMLTPAT